MLLLCLLLTLLMPNFASGTNAPYKETTSSTCKPCQYLNTEYVENAASIEDDSKKESEFESDTKNTKTKKNEAKKNKICSLSGLAKIAIGTAGLVTVGAASFGVYRHFGNDKAQPADESKKLSKPGAKNILVLCDSNAEFCKNFIQKLKSIFPHKSVFLHNATKFRNDAYALAKGSSLAELTQQVKAEFSKLLAKGFHEIWLYDWTPGRFNALYGEEVEDDTFRNFPFNDKILFVVNPDAQNVKDINERFTQGLLDAHSPYKTLSENGRVFWTTNYKRGWVGPKIETWFDDLTKKIIEEDQ